MLPFNWRFWSWKDLFIYTLQDIIGDDILVFTLYETKSSKLRNSNVV
jgi:hypothetical protein